MRFGLRSVRIVGTRREQNGYLQRFSSHSSCLELPVNLVLGAIFADTFILTTSDGKTRTRAEVLAQVKSGEIKYETSKVDDMKVYVYGDAAVVNGRWKAKFVEKGKAVDTTERFTDTYIRQNGQWRCVASQGSTIK